MAASYPGTVKTFTVKVDGAGNIIFAAHVNDLQDEVNAVEGGLLNGVAHVLRPDATANNRDLGVAASARFRDAFLARTLDIAQGTITTDLKAVQVIATWNAGGVTFSPMLVDITDTASATASKLFEGKVGAATKFAVIKDGSVQTGDGAVALSGWSFVADPDTGLYRVSANLLAAAAGGVDVARFLTVASGVNFFEIVPSATTTPLILRAAGTDGNIGITMTPKGTGQITVGANPLRLAADGSNVLDAITKQQLDAFATQVDVLNAATTTVDVVNTVTETDLYNFSVPGGTLGTTNALRLTLIGDLLKNDGGGAATWTIRFYFGATQYLIVTRAPSTNSANRQMFSLLIDIGANGATNAQVAWGIVRSTAGQAPNTSIIITNADPGSLDAYSYNAAIAEDSTIARAFRVSAQWGTANANLSIRLRSAHLEVLR